MIIESAVFGDVYVEFCCSNMGCLCGPEERIIRAYAGGKMKDRPLDDATRHWIAVEADKCGEGMYKAEELLKQDDASLAQALLDAWAMYVDSNC